MVAVPNYVLLGPIDWIALALRSQPKNNPTMMRFARAIALYGALGLFLIVLASQGLGVEFPGPRPGKAKASRDGSSFTLENSVLSATWETEGETLRPTRLAQGSSPVALTRARIRACLGGRRSRWSGKREGDFF